MRKIALISCVKNKLDYPAMAKDLYQSLWFKKAKKFTEIYFNEWYILSAKHYLLNIETIISPYEYTLHAMDKKERFNWASKVYSKILNLGAIGEITIFAGNRYKEYLFPMLIANGYKVLVPTKGMGIGKQLSWFNTQINSKKWRNK